MSIRHLRIHEFHTRTLWPTIPPAHRSPLVATSPPRGFHGAVGHRFGGGGASSAQPNGTLSPLLGDRPLFPRVARRQSPAPFRPLGGSGGLCRGLWAVDCRGFSLSALQPPALAHGAHAAERNFGRRVERISLGHGAQQCVLANGGHLSADFRNSFGGGQRNLATCSCLVAKASRQGGRKFPKDARPACQLQPSPLAMGRYGGDVRSAARRGAALVGRKTSPLALCHQHAKSLRRESAGNPLLRSPLSLAPRHSPGTHVARRGRTPQKRDGHGTRGQRRAGHDRHCGGDWRELQQTPRRPLRLSEAHHPTARPPAQKGRVDGI